MARPPKTMARDTRQEILDASLELFAREGFHGTSMREIARAVGVRESALYHHFPSKDAILQALVQDMASSKVERLQALNLDVALLAGLEPFLRVLAQQVILEWATPREQKFARLMLGEGLRPGSAGSLRPQRELGRAREAIAGLFAELIRRGHVRRMEPDVAAMEFIGPMVMLRMMYLVMAEGRPDLKRLKEAVQRHVTFFCEAVRPPAGGRGR